jgi:hypothetical protein
LLGNEPLADVSTYADDIKTDPEYKYTAPWHYINLPLGMDYNEFKQFVLKDTEPNIYSNLLVDIDNLQHPEKLKGDHDKKRRLDQYMLKLIVHLIADMHQPMCVSRVEDKGGKPIQVQFNGKSSSLYTLWDSGLINKEGKSFDQMAKDYDTATPAEIRKWQSEPVMQWLWESYQVSTKIYGEIEKNNKLDDAYYKANIPIVQQRIEMAGIRLAGVLNTLFASFTPQVNADLTVPAGAKFIQVAAKDVANHVGDNVTVIGTLVSGKLIEGNGTTLLNIGGENPNQDFTIVINSEDRSKFGKPEIDFKGKRIIVHGKVVDYKGKPEIVVTEPKDFQLRLEPVD